MIDVRTPPPPNICLRRGVLLCWTIPESIYSTFFSSWREDILSRDIYLHESQRNSFWNYSDGIEGENSNAGGSGQIKLLQLILPICNNLTTFQSYSITTVNKQQLGEKFSFQTSTFIPKFSWSVFCCDSSTTSLEGVWT